MDDSEALQNQIDDLKAELAELRGTAVSRRSALTRAAAVAAGAVGGALALERPAAAATGGTFVLGNNNTATSSTVLGTVEPTSDLPVAFYVSTNGSGPGSTALWSSIMGAAGNRIGVVGTSTSSDGGFFSGGARAIHLNGPSNASTSIFSFMSVPTTGFHQRGDYVLTGTQVQVCIVDGTPGTFAPMGFNPFGTRLVDSRNATGTIGEPFTSGATRPVVVKNAAGLPNSDRITALSYSLTVINPSNAGYVKLGPHGGTAATIANFTKGVNISASGLTGLATGGLDVTVYGAAADIVMDVTGFFV